MPEAGVAATRVILTAGPLRVVLAPELGGSIARFDWLEDGACRPLMRGAGPDESGGGAASAQDCACFPLVPFANRIRGGRFEFRGETIRLSPTIAHDPSPLHGHGWRVPWELVQRDAASAELRFRHEPGEWPWAYEASQTFTLAADRLDVVLACTNLDERPMPCGLGLHPFHPCDPDTRLATRVDGVWTVDASVLPLAHVPAEGRYDLSDRAICDQDLDNGFDGWSGTALIRWGGAGPALRLTSPGTGFLQVYAPPGRGLFAVEPVQHANGALNAPEAQWADLGLAVLGPGETRSLHARWVVEPT